MLLGNEVPLKHSKKQANGRTGHMNSVAVTQTVRLLGRVLTLSCGVATHCILKHAKLAWTVMSHLVCFRMYGL